MSDAQQDLQLFAPVAPPVSMPRRRARLPALAVLVGALLALPALAVEVPWLYDVEVPVADQSSSARLDGASRALAKLLTRLTGLTSVPRNEAVSRALAAPDLYYNQFRFEAAPLEPAAEGAEPDEPLSGQPADPGLVLRLQFVPQSMLQLIRDARLPIWRSNRPVIVAWLVEDDGRQRTILGADSTHPAVRALREQARDRGLPLRLPLLDLTDQLAVEPAAVWGRLSGVLEAASARYSAEHLLVGRLQQRGEDEWAVSWEFWIEGEARQLQLESRDPAVLGRAAADLAADELAGRYAVFDRGLQRVDLVVSAVMDANDYASLLRYFGGLEFVEEIAITSVAGDRLDISLVTAAGREQLLELFRLDRRLLPDRSLPPGAQIGLVWQGR